MQEFARLVFSGQVGLGIWGVLTLLMGATGPLRGGRARIIGLLAILPYPTCFALGFMYGIFLAIRGEQVDLENAKVGLLLVTTNVLMAYVVAIVILYSKWKREALNRRVGDKSDEDESPT